MLIEKQHKPDAQLSTAFVSFDVLLPLKSQIASDYSHFIFSIIFCFSRSYRLLSKSIMFIIDSFSEDTTESLFFGLALVCRMSN